LGRRTVRRNNQKLVSLSRQAIDDLENGARHAVHAGQEGLGNQGYSHRPRACQRVMASDLPRGERAQKGEGEHDDIDARCLNRVRRY
jgi:hypothetical protein